jgi:hypothetical protein
MNKLRKLIREIVEGEFKSSDDSWKKFRFDDQHRDFSHGQNIYHVDMFDGTKKLAYADYVDFKNKIYISFIESIVKGKGYGSMIMDYLADKYGYENLERSSLTPDGAKMRKGLDKKYNFDPEEYAKSQSKHFDPKLIDHIKIKHPIVAMFLSDMVKYGYEKTWEKWVDYLRDNDLINKYDFNDISDLSTWFRDSVTNNHDLSDEPDYYANEDLKKLL